MYCRKCGTRIRKGIEFCPKCGTQQSGAKAVDDPQRIREEEEHKRVDEMYRNEERQRLVDDSQRNSSSGGGESRTALNANGNKPDSKPKPNKSLIFIVLVIALLVGYSIYSRQNKPTPTPTPTPSSDTHTEASPEGYWWSEAVMMKDGVQGDLFMLMGDNDAWIGSYAFEGSYDNAVGANVDKYDASEVASECSFNSASDEIVLSEDGTDVRFKRANEQQVEIIEKIVEAYKKTNGS